MNLSKQSFQNLFWFVSIFFLLFPFINNGGIASLNSSNTHMGDNFEERITDSDRKSNVVFKTYTIESVQGLMNTTFLPYTNLSVTHYADGVAQDTFNATILSIEPNNWSIQCDYSISLIDGESPFLSKISRISENHTYRAFNYWDWSGNPNDFFEFWIDTNGFYVDYQFDNTGSIVNVSAVETINISSIENPVETWKLMTDTGFGILSSWYEKDSGLYICATITLPTMQVHWYNLTNVEIAELPPAYIGPELIKLTPENESINSPGKLISLEFSSPYGVDGFDYNWDGQINSSSSGSKLEISLPTDDGTHELLVYSYDNISYVSVHRMVFITDSDIPGVFLFEIQNNSRIQGSQEIFLNITSGNGTFIYNWDNTDNTTELGTSSIFIPNPDEEINHTLAIYVKSPAGVWVHTNFILIIDNSPPNITLQGFSNNSVLRGDVDITYNVSEKVILSYLLSDGKNNTEIAESWENKRIFFSNLPNGTYILKITLVDEAYNNNSYLFVFSIHFSAFDWEWGLKAEESHSIEFIDANGNLWFILSIASQVNQSFQVTQVTGIDPPPVTTDLVYALHLRIDEPEEVIVINFSFEMNKSENMEFFDVYQWVFWDEQQSSWLDIDTSYNEVTHSWEGLKQGSVEYFGLKKTGETTAIKSVVVGGGQIPSFSYITAFLGLITLNLIISKKKTRNR